MPRRFRHTPNTEVLVAVTRIPIPAAWAKVNKTDERLALSLSEIDLSVRTVNFLEEARHLHGRRPARLSSGSRAENQEHRADNARNPSTTPWKRSVSTEFRHDRGKSRWKAAIPCCAV